MTHVPKCGVGKHFKCTLEFMRLHVWGPGFTGFQGGIGAFSRALAVALRETGHDLLLMSKLDTPGIWNDFALWGAGRSPSRLRTMHFALRVLAACAIHKPEYIVITHLNFGPVAYLAKRLFGTRFALVAYGIDVHERLSKARRAALRAADMIIAVSAWTRQRLLDNVGVDPSRVVLLAPTVDELRFCDGVKPQALVSRYGLQTGDRVVLTVARLDPTEGYKGYDRVVRALPLVRAICGSVRYIVVGEGADRTRIEAIARDLRIEHAVTCTGFVAQDELADHYRLADVFAMPSTGEGFGVVFLEALACGTPVLAGNRDGSVDALDGGRLGHLLDPNDVHAIASGLTALLQRQGPAWWFDRRALHRAVAARFGHAAFRKKLCAILPA